MQFQEAAETLSKSAVVQFAAILPGSTSVLEALHKAFEIGNGCRAASRPRAGGSVMVA